MENINMKSTQLVADSYKSYHHSVYLYIYYKIGKDEEAKDLSQDVFLRLMDYKQILRPETVKHFIFCDLPESSNGLFASFLQSSRSNFLSFRPDSYLYQ